ncbi:MAG: hypothetical protein GY839_13995 [candidate division Zixibacteria bacterium]|nr:hypothetical protein [candidate division Zixibacteria bacterium]
MLRYLILLLIVLSASIGFSQDKYIFETAVGIGSAHSPFSSEWENGISSRAINYREFAMRGTIYLFDYLSASISAGSIRDAHIPDRYILQFWPRPKYVNYNSERNVFYINPCLTLKQKIIRFSAGANIHVINSGGFPRARYDYPFNGGTPITPSFRLELGAEDRYIVIGSLSSIPLYSGGGHAEIGFAGRSKNGFEHKFFYAASPFMRTNLGYRGEFRIFGNNGLVFSAMFGSENHYKLYSFSIGFKTVQ